jgi:hypothetical protein
LLSLREVTYLKDILTFCASHTKYKKARKRNYDPSPGFICQGV